ncbi:toxin CcdB [Mesorhizobium australicum]|uniref:Toxin CcdB n=2 Tax=Mesorhizobium australicum TaxID=536018 RepID=A0A1X7PYR1_9HYPH|nr:toxin CcdB [Mesorhizobium australicum]
MQADIFERLHVRFCLPLMPDHPKLRPLLRLNPVFPVGDRRYVLHPQHAVSVPLSALRGRPIANLSAHRDEIVAALDFLHQGF